MWRKGFTLGRHGGASDAQKRRNVKDFGVPNKPTRAARVFPALAILAAGVAQTFAAPGPGGVASVARSPETPVTARLAPSSSLSPSVAELAAARLAPLVAGTQAFTVEPTGSMRPAFDDNTVLLTEPAPFGDLRVGDIVIFRHSSGYSVVHRIVERRGAGYWTRGDHSIRMDDELVTASNYVGRVYGILYTSRQGRPPLPEPLRKAETVLAGSP